MSTSKRRRAELLYVYFTRAEIALVRRVAAAEGLRPSTWLREQTVALAQQKRRSARRRARAQRPPGAPDPLELELERITAERVQAG